MELTLDSLNAEVKETYKGLTVKDAPNGPLLIRAVATLNPSDVKKFTRIQKQLESLDDDEEQFDKSSKMLVSLLALASERPDDLKQYVKDFNVAQLTQIFKIWARESQLGEA